MNTQPVGEIDGLAPGLCLGRYELIRRIAVGGMAEIYLARATGIQGFQKLVVLKRILPQLASNSDFVAMFLDEARLSARLQHPNIAQVHDIGQWSNSFFFTMEYIRGEDVRTILKDATQRGVRVPLSIALTIISGAAAGLHAAHEKRGMNGEPLNVVHRDVSPSNVLVSYDGSVKLVDFGVAKAAHRQTETQAGTLKGKVSYMSPEQCRGRHIDRRSDVFALGILLYELSCCRRLFKGDSEFEIMTKIVHEDVQPPSETMPEYPKGLEKILLRALQRDPEQRYPTTQDMQIDIEDFCRREQIGTSIVKLGQYMRDVFVDRMREDDAAIIPRAQTEELSLDMDENLPDLHVAGESRPANVRAVGTPPCGSDSVHTGMFGAPRAPTEALSESSQLAAYADTPVQSDLDESIEIVDEAASSIAPSGRRAKMWLFVTIAGVTAVAALFVLGGQQPQSPPEAPKAVVTPPHASNEQQPAENSNPSTATTPNESAQAQDDNPASTDEAPAAADPATTNETSPSTAVEQAKTEVSKTPERAKTKRRTKRSSSKRSTKSRPRKQPRRSEVTQKSPAEPRKVSQPKPQKRAKPRRRSWQLDSPLPPPKKQ